MILAGTCGFPKSRAEFFDMVQAVEVQESFYKHVDLATVKKWRRESPKGYAFAVKASQFITHEPSSPTYRRTGLDIDANAATRYGSFRMTREVLSAWRRTEETCRILDAKAVLFQTPPTFKPSSQNIESLDSFMKKAQTEMLRVWEPRGEWPREVIDEICDRHDLVHCVDPFDEEPVTTGKAYFHLHGKPPGSRRYYYTYSDAELRRIREISKNYDTVFVFFNNVSMFTDAVRFRRLLDV